jgi:hypothetical protein
MVSIDCFIQQIASDTDLRRIKHAGRHPEGLADGQSRDNSQASCMEPFLSILFLFSFTIPWINKSSGAPWPRRWREA